MTASWYASPQFERLLTLLRERGGSATTTTQVVQIVPIESRPVLPSYPAAFQSRREQPVASIIRRDPIADPLQEDARVVGSAVALTADGWFGTTASALGGLRLADLELALGSRTLPITKAIKDTATDLVFLKVETGDLPVAAFVRADDVVAGTAVWVESGRGLLRPETIVSVRMRATSAPTLSEAAIRRFRVTGPDDQAMYRGAAVWDGGGKLLGFLSLGKADSWEVIPASFAASALGSLLSDGVIRRSTLGIRTQDLDSFTFEDERPLEVPRHGALLKAASRALPAVLPTGPSAGVLREGDVIERLDRDILDGEADLGERLLDYRPGASLTVSGSRAGQPLSVEVILGEAVTSESVR
jgi:S1-C subfamily serine protease